MTEHVDRVEDEEMTPEEFRLWSAMYDTFEIELDREIDEFQAQLAERPIWEQLAHHASVAMSSVRQSYWYWLRKTTGWWGGEKFGVFLLNRLFGVK